MTYTESLSNCNKEDVSTWEETIREVNEESSRLRFQTYFTLIFEFVNLSRVDYIARASEVGRK